MLLFFQCQRLLLSCCPHITSNTVTTATAPAAIPTRLRLALSAVSAEPKATRSSMSPPTRAQSHRAGLRCDRMPIPVTISRRPKTRNNPARSSMPKNLLKTSCCHYFGESQSNAKPPQCTCQFLIHDALNPSLNPMRRITLSPSPMAPLSRIGFSTPSGSTAGNSSKCLTPSSDTHPCRSNA